MRDLAAGWGLSSAVAEQFSVLDSVKGSFFAGDMVAGSWWNRPDVSGRLGIAGVSGDLVASVQGVARSQVRLGIMQDGVQPNLLASVQDVVRPELRLGIAQDMQANLLASVQDAITSSVTRATENWSINFSPKIDVGAQVVGDLGWWRGVERSTIESLQWGLSETVKQEAFPPTSILARDLGIAGIGAFAGVPAARYADLLDHPEVDGPDLQDRVVEDSDVVAAVAEIVESEPVEMLVENLSPADMSEARRARPSVRERINGLSFGQTVTIFGSLELLITAAVLEAYGQGEIVGAVADVLGWPMGLIGLAGFAAMLNGPRRS